MIALTATTHSLEIVSGQAYNLDWTVTYVDSDSAGAHTPASDAGQIVTATDTTVVAAPGASTFRKLLFMSVVNVDNTNNNSVQLQKDVSGTERKITPVVTLRPGESLQYMDGIGFQLFDATGRLKTNAYNPNGGSQWMQPHGFCTVNQTSARTATSTQTFCVYMGKAPRAMTSVDFIFRVTTALGAAITYAEVAVGRGNMNPSGNMTVVPLGYTDVSGVVNSTGIKRVTVTPSAGQTINEGDDLWFIIGTSTSGTNLALRSATISDELQLGYNGTVTGSVQPSTQIGVGVVFTIDGTSTNIYWVAMGAF